MGGEKCSFIEYLKTTIWLNALVCTPRFFHQRSSDESGWCVCDEKRLLFMISISFKNRN